MKPNRAFRLNTKQARAIWGELRKETIFGLKELVDRHGLSVLSGDLQLLDGKWYVTHSGLLRVARRSRCSGITTSIDRFASDASKGRWVFKAVVYKAGRAKRFVAYGDADPSNVSPLVRGAEMRVAETRAVNRALRKAYGIGLCSVEELGSFSSALPVEPARCQHNRSHPPVKQGSTNCQPRLRDRLCLLIRQHRLDASLVKSYAADYCGTVTLREASRDLVEAFISHLSEWATKDREGLVSRLSSYAKSPEQELHA